MSLSGDAYILAVGGPGDDNWVGATWLFVYVDELERYIQTGDKLVGQGYEGGSRQGKDRKDHMMVSLAGVGKKSWNIYTTKVYYGILSVMLLHSFLTCLFFLQATPCLYPGMA